MPLMVQRHIKLIMKVMVRRCRLETVPKCNNKGNLGLTQIILGCSGSLYIFNTYG